MHYEKLSENGETPIYLHMADTGEDRRMRETLVNRSHGDSMYVDMSASGTPSAPMIYTKDLVQNIQSHGGYSAYMGGGDNNPSIPLLRSEPPSDEEVDLSKYENMPVSRIDVPSIVARFRFRHYLSLSLIMFMAYLPPVFIIGSEINTDLFLNHLWIPAFLVFSILLVFLIWWFDWFHRFSYTNQMVIIFLTILILIATVCVLSISLDTLMFAKGALLSSIFIFAFGLYCLQSWCGLSKMGMLIVILIAGGAVSFVILYLPYRDLIDQRDYKAIQNAPPSFWSTVYSLSSAIVILGMFVWRSMANEQKVCPKDYLYATFLIFTDGFVLMALLVKDLCCSRMCGTSSGVGTSVANGTNMWGSIKEAKDKIAAI